MKRNIFERLKNEEWLYGGASDCPEVSEKLQKAADACFDINSMRPSEKERREAAFRLLLGSVGAHFLIHSPFRCDFGFNIHIGENFVGNFNLSILDEAEVRIGDNVMIGPNCSLITITHALEVGPRVAGYMQARPITIGNNVWLASNVTVLPGISIGDGAVVGAGSVVTHDIPANEVWSGNPAHFIRKIRNESE